MPFMPTQLFLIKVIYYNFLFIPQFHLFPLLLFSLSFSSIQLCTNGLFSSLAFQYGHLFCTSFRLFNVFISLSLSFSVDFKLSIDYLQFCFDLFVFSRSSGLSIGGYLRRTRMIRQQAGGDFRCFCSSVTVSEPVNSESSSSPVR